MIRVTCLDRKPKVYLVQVFGQVYVATIGEDFTAQKSLAATIKKAIKYQKREAMNV